MKDSRSIIPLQKMLDDNHDFVRKEAILSLGYLVDKSMKDLITTIEENDKSSRVRKAASRFLLITH